jgi:uncharacterized protein YfaS (alpha-2-macroglobulin family)
MRARVALCLSMAAALGCGGDKDRAEKPKEQQKGAALAPQPEAPPPAPKAPPNVVFTSPTRRENRVDEVVAVFDRPMSKRDTAISLTPAVAGTSRWVGDHALAFMPSKPLADGEYQAVIATATAEDGAPLKAPRQWSFRAGPEPAKPSTPPKPAEPQPLEVRSAVLQKGDVLTAARQIRVRLSGPVRLADVEKNASIRIPKRKDPLGVKARYEKARDHRVVLLKPAAIVPGGPAATLHLAAGLPAEDNPLPLRTEFTETFSTELELKVSFGCPQEVGAPMRLYFSQKVRPAALMRKIKVTPATPLRVLTDQSEGGRIVVGGNFEPGKKFRITVKDGLTGAENSELLEDATVLCLAPRQLPTVQLAVSGTLLESAGPTELPVWTYDVPKVGLKLWSVPPEKAGWSVKSLVDLPPTKESALPGTGAKVGQIFVDPAPALAGGHGIALVVVQGTDDAGKPIEKTLEHLLVNATDLGIHAKRSPGATFAWVTRLSSGAPVAGAEVALRSKEGSVIGKAVTDEDGVATVSHGTGDARSSRVFASKEGDLAVAWMDERERLRGADYFPSGARRKATLRGLLFSERGVYRPGDTVRLKGIVRREKGGLETLDKARVQVQVQDSKGEEIFSQSLAVSEFGTFSVDASLSEAAPLGEYRATVSGGGCDGSVTAEFRVEEFRAPDFAVEVLAPRKDKVAGQTWEVRAQGRYLFGAKMAKAPVSWTVTSRASRFTPAGYPGFSWRPAAWQWEGQYIDPSSSTVASDEGFLDEHGEKAIRVKRLDPDRIYTVEAQVKGLDRTTIAGRASVQVHPAAFYLGAKSERGYFDLDKKEPLRTELIAVTPEGKPSPGVAIEAVVYRGGWDSVQRLYRGGKTSFANRPAPKEVARCALTSGEAPVVCEHVPTEGGSYVLWATAKDAAGRKVQTSFSYYVYGGSGGGWAASTSNAVKLRTDRSEYRVGDTAVVLVENPFPDAQALITVEREGVLRHFRQPLVGSAPAVRIPVTADLFPNAFVTVAVIRGRAEGPRTLTGDDPRRPMAKLGVANLKVSLQSLRAEVRVRPARKEYRPGEEVSVALQALGPDGKPLAAELAVWAVDEGVLSLSAYRTPDPVRSFEYSANLSVSSFDTRNRYLHRKPFVERIQRGNEKGEEPAGDDDEKGSRGAVRRKLFKVVAFFDPAVRTDARGQATVRFKLPDNLTTYRIMAVAASKGLEFGSGDAKVVSTKPLLLQPSLPRFVRAGDSFEGGVVVHNRTHESAEAKIRIAAQGLSIVGAGERVVRVEAGRGLEVRFPLRAEKAGGAKLDFDVAMGRERDGLSLARTVALMSPTENVGLSGEAKDAEVRHAVGPVPGASPTVGGLEVVASGSRLAGLASALSYLLEYPYGCAEQTTSSLLPVLAMRDLAEATGESLTRDVGTLIRAGLARLATFQHESGGFTLWQGGRDPTLWVTSYVLFGMAEAAQRGNPVDQKVIEAGVKFLSRALRSEGKKDGYEYKADDNERAYALYALSAFGAPDPSYAATLFEQRAKLDVDGRAVLARALVRMGDKERAAKLIAELVASAQVAGGEVKLPAPSRESHFGSRVRTQALLLEALAAYDPTHDLVPKLVASILGARRDGRWRTTQESAYALFALVSAERSTTTSQGALVYVNGAKKLEEKFGVGKQAFRRLFVPMAELAQGAADLRVAPLGNGTVHYAVRLIYAPTTPSREPRDHGLAIERTYERVLRPDDGAATFATPSIDAVAAGSLLRVTLHLVVPEVRQHVIVDDPLPAGLEAVNLALATEARATVRAKRERPAPSEGESEGEGERSEGEESSEGSEERADEAPIGVFTHRELRDDRVVLYAPRLAPGLHRATYLARATVPGRFGAPAARAEAMYDPQFSGSTGARTFTVAAPAGGVASQ